MSIFSRKNDDVLRLLASVGVGIGMGVVASVWWKRWMAICARTGENAQGTTPHTDYSAASKIGQETGGEVFDD